MTLFELKCMLKGDCVIHVYNEDSKTRPIKIYTSPEMFASDADTFSDNREIKEMNVRGDYSNGSDEYVAGSLDIILKKENGNNEENVKIVLSDDELEVLEELINEIDKKYEHLLIYHKPPLSQYWEYITSLMALEKELHVLKKIKKGSGK